MFNKYLEAAVKNELKGSYYGKCEVSSVVAHGTGWIVCFTHEVRKGSIEYRCMGFSKDFRTKFNMIVD